MSCHFSSSVWLYLHLQSCLHLIAGKIPGHLLPIIIVIYNSNKNKKINNNNNNNSKDQHINLKEESHLRSIFQDAKKYSDELNIECEFDDGATILKSSDKEIHASNKELQKVKSIINKANTDRQMKDVQNQLWVGKFVTQHWNDPQISNNSYDIFKQWKNIPDIVMSIDHFTVVGLVTWSLNGSEAGGDLVLIQTSPL